MLNTTNDAVYEALLTRALCHPLSSVATDYARVAARRYGFRSGSVQRQAWSGSLQVSLFYFGSDGPRFHHGYRGYCEELSGPWRKCKDLLDREDDSITLRVYPRGCAWHLNLYNFTAGTLGRVERFREHTILRGLWFICSDYDCSRLPRA